MATAIFMPKAGMAMEEGTLIRWLKKVGEHVEKNEPVMEIETDKITMESEAPTSGILLATLVDEGSTVPVLQTIGWIGEAGEAIPEADGTAEAGESVSNANTDGVEVQGSEAPKQFQQLTGIPATPYAKSLIRERNLDILAVQPTGKHGEIVAADVLALAKGPKSTPLAAKIANNEGIALSDIDGSGSRGRIMKDDVLQAVSKKQAGMDDAAGETRQKLSGMRKIIAERMMRSYSEIPAVTQDTDMDVTELLLLRRRINEGRDEKCRLSINDFIMRAVALASVKYPDFRSRLEADQLITSPHVHLGMAVSTESGLLVPVIRHADRLSLSALSAAAKDLAGRARNSKLQPDELMGSTLSISNLGMYGVSSFTPIINQPNPAIVGVCSIRDEAAINGANELYNRKVMRVSLTYDHRIMDGAVAASFALYIKELLENPLNLLV